MNNKSFSDRYTGRIQWKLTELKKLAKFLNFDIFDVIDFDM